MRRRGPGEGSIFKDPRTGRWRALLDVGEDAAGRRRRRKVSGRARGRGRCQAARAAAGLRGRSSSTRAPGDRRRVERRLAAPSRRRAAGTHARTSAEWAVRQHLVPSLGARRVRELTADDVARFLQDKAAAGYAHATLGEFPRGSDPGTPARQRQGLVCPQRRSAVPTPAGPRTHGRSLTVEQAHTLLASSQGHPLEAAITVALTCGLRPGCWRCGGEMSTSTKISCASSRPWFGFGGRQLSSCPPRPRRRGASSGFLARPWRFSGNTARARTRSARVLGEHWQESGLVFTTGFGTLLDPRTCVGACVRSPNAPASAAGTRTSCATAQPACLSAAGVPLEEVADVLGAREYAE